MLSIYKIDITETQSMQLLIDWLSDYFDGIKLFTPAPWIYLNELFSNDIGLFHDGEVILVSWFSNYWTKNDAFTVVLCKTFCFVFLLLEYQNLRNELIDSSRINVLRIRRLAKLPFVYSEVTNSWNENAIWSVTNLPTFGVPIHEDFNLVHANN